MTTLNPPMTPAARLAATFAAPADAAPAARRLARGFGLTLSALVSLGLWAGLAHAAAALIA
jgi:hypothetical protein